MPSSRYEDILRKGFEEYQQFVNPLIAQRAKLAGEPIEIISTEGGKIVTREGQALEDFHGTQAFGHRNAYVAQELQNFLNEKAPSWYPSRVSPFSGRLARKLCERSAYYEQVYFGCTGSDAVEAALKLARAATKKTRILGLERAYHGCGFGSTAIMAKGPFRDPFGPHLPGAESIPFGDTDALKHAFEQGDVGAIVVEPIQGEGGIRPLPEKYIEALGELTEKHQALLIADEVQTALGRSGNFIASANWPRRPDVVLLAKALGGGLVPISATMTRAEVFERAYGKNFESAEAHNSTFSYNAIGAVAGLATLELLTDEVIHHVKTLGEEFRHCLREALKDSPLFTEVRGAGLMVGVQLKSPEHPWLSFEQFGYPDLADHATIGPILCHRLYQRGYFCFVCGHDWSVLRLQPRFDIEKESLVAFANACREELEYIHELT